MSYPKQTFKNVSIHLDKNIKVGDQVKLTDGSGLTKNDGQKLYIVFDYKDIEPFVKLRDLIFKVTKTSVIRVHHYSDSIISSNYLQDIEIEYKGKTLYTCSAFVTKNI